MNVITRLLHFQVLARTLAIFLLGNLILISWQIALTLEDIAAGKLDLDFLWQVTLLLLITDGGFILNICYLLTLLFLLAGLYTHNEIYIMKNLGIGDMGTLRILLVPSLFIVVLVGALEFYLAPKSATQIETIYSNKLASKFQDLDESSFDFGGSTSYRMQDGMLEIWKVGEHSVAHTRASFTPKLPVEGEPLHLPLRDGQVFVWADSGAFRQSEFEQAEIGLEQELKFNKDAETLDSMELLREEFGAEAGPQATPDPERREELYKRISIVFSSFLVLPLALVASRRGKRASSTACVIGGLSVYFVYLVLMVVAIGILGNGGSSWFLWTAHLGGLAVAFFALLLPDLRGRGGLSVEAES